MKTEETKILCSASLSTAGLGLSFAERCAIAEKSLPAAPYRKMLENLHNDMLAEIELLNANIMSGPSLRDWIDQSASLDKALVVCRSAERVIASSAYQGVSDEDCDLEISVKNWQAQKPNAKVTGSPALSASPRGLPG